MFNKTAIEIKMGSRSALTGLTLLCALWAAAGCGESQPCEVGQSQACSCLDGRQGIQSCGEDLFFDECRCDGSSLRGDGGNDDGALDPARQYPAARDAGTTAYADTSTPPSSTVPAGAKRVFVTSTVYSGDLLSYVPGADTGVTAADAHCQQVAQGAMLEGSWIAWLSAANYTTPIHAIDRVSDVGPWYLLNGHKAFNNRANLAGTPLTYVNVNERGEEIWDLNRTERIWTGSKAGGTLAGGYTSCSGWMSNSGEGMTGRVGSSDTGWSAGTLEYCIDENHLFCIEQ